MLALTRQWHALVFFLAGAGLFLAAALPIIDSRLAHEFEGDSILTEVTVIDFPKHSGASVSLLLRPLNDARLPQRLRVSWFEPPQALFPGEVWQMELRLRRPRGSSNSGVFDYETWLFREGIGAVGYVVPGKRNQRLGVARLSPIQRFRADFVKRTRMAIDDRQLAAVLVAIAIGTRHLLSPEQWQRYASTGTSHLMAISGLHVGLAGASAYLLVSAFLAATGVRRCNRDIAIGGALCLAALYVAVSGFAVPARRALLMLSLAALALLRRRQLRAAPLLSTACFVIVLLDPLSTMSPGFKLSFAAVALLLWLGKRFEQGSGAVRQLVSLQFVLLAGLAPLTVPIFHRVALFAPLVNLAAVPVFSFITVPATLLSAVLEWRFLFTIAALSVDWVERLIGLVASLPLADTHVAGSGLQLAPLLLLAFAWAAAPPGWPGRTVAWLALVGILTCRPEPPPFGCAEVTVMDVGQGLAVSVRTQGHVLLYDTGPSYRGGSSAAERVVIPALKMQGVSRINTVVVSHGDLDHAGGLAPIRAAMSVGETWHSDPGAEERRCRRGLGWEWDGIHFRFLHPGADAAGGRNDGSCVLLVAAGRHRLLLTGDIETGAESELVQLDLLDKADIVTVPHHGSQTSSSLPFVHRLAPRYAIVTAGFGNRWGFPRQDIVSRWQSQSATVLETATSGAIGMSLCQRSGASRVRLQRELQRRFWYEP